MNNTINTLPSGDFSVNKTPTSPTLTREEQEAVQRYKSGKRYSMSTHIDDDTIIAGYGELKYDFEFPLPTTLIKELYGTTSWKVYLESVDKNKKKLN